MNIKISLLFVLLCFSSTALALHKPLAQEVAEVSAALAKKIETYYVNYGKGRNPAPPVRDTFFTFLVCASSTPSSKVPECKITCSGSECHFDSAHHKECINKSYPESLKVAQAYLEGARQAFVSKIQAVKANPLINYTGASHLAILCVPKGKTPLTAFPWDKAKGKTKEEVWKKVVSLMDPESPDSDSELIDTQQSGIMNGGTAAIDFTKKDSFKLTNFDGKNYIVLTFGTSGTGSGVRRAGGNTER